MLTSATLQIEAMASPTPKRPRPPQVDPFARYPPRPPGSGSPVRVAPSFLIKALGLTILAAILCAYLALCLLVWLGGWQRMLHPSAAVAATPAAAGIPFEPIRFDTAATGSPRLTGWWIPSDSATAPTILYLHDGDGSLSAALPGLALLHRAGVNIFALDYRGYGQSQGPHPTQKRMQEDTAAALDYLTYSRHIPVGKIVPYGVGLGGVLAARLAAEHPELPALIVDQPRPDAYRNAVDVEQSRFLPMRLLIGEHFDIAAALTGPHQPRLLLVNSPLAFDPRRAKTNQDLFRASPDPKTTVTFDRTPAEDEYRASLHRFLDEVVK